MHTVCYTSSIILDIKVNLESYSKISLVLFHCIQDAQNLNEEIDNIEVQVDRGQNVFLRRQLMHQHVSVKHNESRKQQSSSNGIHQLKGLTVEEKLEGSKNKKTIVSTA